MHINDKSVEKYSVKPCSKTSGVLQYILNNPKEKVSMTTRL